MKPERGVVTTARVQQSFSVSMGDGSGDADPELLASPRLGHRLYAEHSEDRGPAGIHTTELSACEVLAYAHGHILNDMCAACWFTYLLVFLQNAVGMQALYAGYVMLSGQVADAMATPAVGLLSDRSKGIPRLGLGRRKAWNAGGAFMVLVCFTFVFTLCLPKLLSPDPATLVLVLYYALAASLFNVGWASVQVSHMALVPELSPHSNTRLLLNSARYAATIFSNIFVFVVFLALLHFLPPHDDKTPSKFHYLGAIVAATGTVCSIIFLVGTPEPESRSHSVASSRTRSAEVAAPLLQNSSSPLESAPPSRDTHHAPAAGSGRGLQNLVRGSGDRDPPSAGSLRSGTDSRTGPASNQSGALKASPPAPAAASRGQRRKRMTWKCWFRRKLFYQVGLVYMCTRLVVNVSQTYIPFYLLHTLNMSPLALALVPLLVYVASFVATLVIKRVNKLLRRKGTFTLGALLVLSSSVVLQRLDHHTANVVYLAAFLLGFGNATIMVTSVSMEADLVGDNVESGAFVYGFLSFTDKLSNGIAVIVIQAHSQLASHEVSGSTSGSGEFMRNVVSWVPAIAATVGVLCTYTTRASDFEKDCVDPSGRPSGGSGAHKERPGVAGQRSADAEEGQRGNYLRL